jgi:hypothetical protein
MVPWEFAVVFDGLDICKRWKRRRPNSAERDEILRKCPMPRLRTGMSRNACSIDSLGIFKLDQDHQIRGLIGVTSTPLLSSSALIPGPWR